MTQLDCTQARTRIEDLLDGYLAGETAAEVRNHIVTCKACAGAHAAGKALRAELGRMPVPAIRPGFAAEAFAAATAATRTTRPVAPEMQAGRAPGVASPDGLSFPTRPARRNRWRRPELWIGAALGAAAAATLVAVLWGIPQGGSAPGHAPGQVAEPSPGDLQVSLYETREVGVAIDTATAMPGATLTITVAGGIDLAGFGDRREVQWQTDLDAGTNLLSLPIIAHSLEQGRLTALVEHGDQTQRIELTVRVSDPAPN